MTPGPMIPVLLVDDNEDDVILTRDALARGRVLQVTAVARDGEEALAMLRRDPPHHRLARPALVLLDINMPRMDGFQVLAAIKAEPALRCIPVVMLTTSPREEDVARAYAEGAASYVRKPVDIDEFHRVVRAFELYWSAVSRVPGV